MSWRAAWRAAGGGRGPGPGLCQGLLVAWWAFEIVWLISRGDFLVGWQLAYNGSSLTGYVNILSAFAAVANFPIERRPRLLIRWFGSFNPPLATMTNRGFGLADSRVRRGLVRIPMLDYKYRLMV